MELRLLGPVEAIADGRSVALGRRQERLLLAILALRPGVFHPIDRIADLLWAQEPPPAARGGIQAMVSHLRSALRPLGSGAPLLRSHSTGYLLEIEREAVDLHRFRSLVDMARAEPSVQRRTMLLAGAQELWRGPVLADLVGEQERFRLFADLEELQLAVREEWLECRLRLGQHRILVEPLTQLVGRHPLRERPVALLMLALYRCGRRGDALSVHGGLIERLRVELGLDPGEALRRLHTAILRDDPVLAGPTAALSAAAPTTAGAAPAGVAGPAQLPADIPAFAGRTEQLARLDALLESTDAQPPRAVVISAVSGTAGVGKTALAVHWAHRAAGEFPDGQLYVNLRGFGPAGQAMGPAEAVRGFLDALGVAPERVPPGLHAQVGLYRSVLAGRRVLVVLDNARDADQVRPLLPGSSTALVVVTSRNQLTSLVALDGAHPLTLDLLSTMEARELLVRRLGAGVVDAEPRAAEQVISACARLPLALSIVAARAQQTGFRLSTLAAELAEAGRRLDALDAGDPTSQVRAVFSWSYRPLSLPAARLFRLLGLHSGRDIRAAAAASLAGHPLPRTRRLLAELVRANLLTEHTPDRYTLHDLLRGYASDLAGSDDTDQARQAATTRLLDHYTHTAYAAAQLLDPHRQPIGLPLAPPAPGTSPEHPADRREAVAWLTAEHQVLLATLRQAADTGFDTHTWQLAGALDTFLYRRGHWNDQAAAWQAALRAAQRLGAATAQAVAHRGLAHADTLLARHADAHAHLKLALDLYTQAGDLPGQATTHDNLAVLWGRRGHPDKALDHAQQALTIFQATGDGRGQAHALNVVGWYHALLGDHSQALTHCEQALAVLQRLGDQHSEASTWDSLGYAYHRLGHHGQAIDCYQQAVTLVRDLGDRYQEAITLTRLGDTHHTAGHRTAAHDAWQQALDIFTDLDHPDADNVRTKLDNHHPRTTGRHPA